MTLNYRITVLFWFYCEAQRRCLDCFIYFFHFFFLQNLKFMKRKKFTSKKDHIGEIPKNILTSVQSVSEYKKWSVFRWKIISRIFFHLNLAWSRSFILIPFLSNSLIWKCSPEKKDHKIVDLYIFEDWKSKAKSN